jgi:hypothetical protein
MSPVASTAALAWCGYARKALHEAVDDAEHGVELTSDVVPSLERFLDDWEGAATRGPTVTVSFDLSSAEAEYLSHAFFRIAGYLADRARARGFDDAPPEGEAFYSGLVEAVIDALEQSEDGSTAEFADYLRAFWPRITEIPYGDAP